MVQNERNTRNKRILQAADAIMNAARTAPKGKGMDNVEIVTISGDDVLKLADMMDIIGNQKNIDFFHRDANNIRNSEAVILIGSKNAPIGLNCALCGFLCCNDKPQNIPCVFNTIDVGIAIGAACSMAQTLCVDTRVMFSAGKTVEETNLLPECQTIFAIPLSTTSKNIYFDRVIQK